MKSKCSNNKSKSTNFPGVSVKFLMVAETNAMIGYLLMAKGHLIQLGVWEGGGGTVSSPPTWRY